MSDFIIRLVKGSEARDPFTYINPDGTVSLGVDLLQQPAHNTPGSVSSVLPNTTTTVVSFTPTGTYDLEGFIIRGSGDAEIMLSISSGNWYPEYINRNQPSAKFILPRAHRVIANQLIKIEATTSIDNNGDSNFHGVILGRYLS